MVERKLQKIKLKDEEVSTRKQIKEGRLMKVILNEKKKIKELHLQIYPLDSKNLVIDEIKGVIVKPT